MGAIRRLAVPRRTSGRAAASRRGFKGEIGNGSDGEGKGAAGLVVFVVRCSSSATLAYILGLAVGLSYPMWASISAVVVSQEQLGETWASVGSRIAGTVLGVCVAIAVNAAAARFGVGVAPQVALSVAVCAGIAHWHPAIRVSMWTCPIVLLTGISPTPCS